VTPLISQLTTAFNTAQASLGQLSPVESRKRQSDEDVAVLVAGIIAVRLLGLIIKSNDKTTACRTPPNRLTDLKAVSRTFPPSPASSFKSTLQILY
jgi:hypothetical protein